MEAHLRRKAYDLVILNGSDLLWTSSFLPPSLPRLLVAHNIEHLLFRYQIRNLGGLSRPLRGLLTRDCQRLENFEWEGIRQAGNAIFLSLEEAAHAYSFCPDLRSVAVPPLFDYEPLSRPPQNTGSILNVGLVANFGWWPNQLGLRWFVNEVLPLVKSPIRLHLFGHRGRHQGLNDPRVIAHGMVESIERIWAMCDFLICPAVASGGVSVKFAEAAYNGMPILATTEAARGLGLDQDPALVFLDQARDWADLLSSPAAKDLGRRRVSANIASRFAVDTHRQVLQQFVQSVMATAAASGSR